jgi:hypothetical protein
VEEVCSGSRWGRVLRRRRSGGIGVGEVRRERRPWQTSRLMARGVRRWRRRPKERNEIAFSIQLAIAVPNTDRHDLSNAASEWAPLCVNPKLTGDIKVMMHGDEQAERGVVIPSETRRVDLQQLTEPSENVTDVCFVPVLRRIILNCHISKPHSLLEEASWCLLGVFKLQGCSVVCDGGQFTHHLTILFRTKA